MNAFCSSVSANCILRAVISKIVCNLARRQSSGRKAVLNKQRDHETLFVEQAGKNDFLLRGQCVRIGEDSEIPSIDIVAEGIDLPQPESAVAG